MIPRPVVVAHLGAPFPFGIVRWRQHGAGRVTFVAKLTFALENAALVADQEPLRGRDDADAYDPGDFVPRKAGADLLLRGSVRGPSGAPHVVGSIAVPAARRRGAAPHEGAWRRDLHFVARTPAALVPLADAREPDGATPAGPLDRIAPRDDLPPRAAQLAPDVDFAIFQAAAPAQQLDALPARCTIVLGGALAGPGGERPLQLPEAPWVFLDRGFGDGQVLDLVCDTLTVDLDAGVMIAVWRGDQALDEADLADLDRVLVRWAPGPPAPGDDPRRGVPRASFVLADELGRAPQPTDADVLRAAAFDALEVAAEPTISIRQYATISATLAEGRPARDQVLARHGFTEATWAAEERAHGEAIADGAWRGDVDRAAELGDAFVAAQDALAAPSEASWTVEQHAEVTAALEVTRDVLATLRAFDLSQGAYMRLDRRIAALVATDREANARFEAALEAARAANPEPPDEDDDPDGDEEDDA